MIKIEIEKRINEFNGSHFILARQIHQWLLESFAEICEYNKLNDDIKKSFDELEISFRFVCLNIAKQVLKLFKSNLKQQFDEILEKL